MRRLGDGMKTVSDDEDSAMLATMEELRDLRGERIQEHANMVASECQSPTGPCTSQEECAHVEQVHYVEPGKAIADSGCTSPVIGERTWESWLPAFRNKGIEDRISYEREERQFKFGNGTILRSNRKVRFPIKLYGIEKMLEASIVPGETPMLLAKKTMAEWGIVQDYRNGKVLLTDHHDQRWHQMETGDKGHFLFDLLGGFKTLKVAYANSSQVNMVIDEKQDKVDDIFKVEKERKMASFVDDELVHRYYEIFKDQNDVGSRVLRQALAARVDEISYPEYDLRKRDDRGYLLQKFKGDQPEHVLFVPPDKVWSRQKSRLPGCREERSAQSKTLLALTSEICRAQHEEGRHCTIRFPAESEAWNDKVMKSLENITQDISVNNQRFRTTSKVVQEALCHLREPEKLSEVLAKAIVQEANAGTKKIQEAKYAEDEQEDRKNLQAVRERENELKGKFSNEVINVVKKLHSNLASKSKSTRTRIDRPGIQCQRVHV